MPTFETFDTWWWPYVFMLVAGVLATDIWRWVGVVAGGSLREGSAALDWVRAVATALVACVIGQLVLFPSGELVATPAWLRIAAAALGWLAFWFGKKSVLLGVAVAEVVLFTGWTLLA